MVRDQLTREPAADVLTTSQAARLLGISVRTAQLWIEGGSLRSWKTPGGHRRVYRHDVMALINRSRPAELMRPTGPAQGAVADLSHDAFVLDEARRLIALEESGLVDSAPEPAFDRLTWLATHTLEMPVSLVTVLTSTRQWFKARSGLDMVETPRDWSFCNQTILQRDVFTVENLTGDARFADNPAVAGDPFFRFYAGAPVIDPDGFALGAMCVIDYKPRRLTSDQRTILLALADIASDQLRLRAAERRLRAIDHPAKA